MRFAHRGLRRFYERGDSSKLNPNHAKRIRQILSNLEYARAPRNLSRRGWRLHMLRGNRSGFWSVHVSGNWRIVFRFQDGEAVDIDLIDYH